MDDKLLFPLPLILPIGLNDGSTYDLNWHFCFPYPTSSSCGKISKMLYKFCLLHAMISSFMTPRSYFIQPDFRLLYQENPTVLLGL